MKKSLQNINIEHTAYCPHCKVVTNLQMTITLRKVPGREGKTELLTSRTYHCESCRSFVQSKDDVSFLACEESNL